MKKQIYDDGVDFEASICYHRLVLELFFFSAVYIIKNASDFKRTDYIQSGKKIFGEEFIDRLYKMFNFVLYTLKPDGKMPQIGDNDNGRFFIFSKREILDMRYLLTFGAIFFKKPKFKIKEFGFCKEALWIFGEEGYKVWKNLDENSYKNIDSRSFDDSGIYIMRKNKQYLLASCGPNGQNGNGGHAHNDKLSFVLCVNGVDVLVDPGTYVYTPLPEKRNQFRSTYFHNTVAVDNKEQNRFRKNNLFSLENDAKTEIINWKTTNEYDLLEAKHLGYRRLINPIIHKRQIVFNKLDSFWLVRDIIKGEGKHKFELHFNLDSRLESKIDKDSMEVIIPIGKKKLRIIPVYKEEMDFSIKKGWVSKEYGKKDESIVLRYSKDKDTPVEFLFLFTFNGNVKNILSYVKKVTEKNKK